MLKEIVKFTQKKKRSATIFGCQGVVDLGGVVSVEEAQKHRHMSEYLREWGGG